MIQAAIGGHRSFFPCLCFLPAVSFFQSFFFSRQSFFFFCSHTRETPGESQKEDNRSTDLWGDPRQSSPGGWAREEGERKKKIEIERKEKKKVEKSHKKTFPFAKNT